MHLPDGGMTETAKKEQKHHVFCATKASKELWDDGRFDSALYFLRTISQDRRLTANSRALLLLRLFEYSVRELEQRGDAEDRRNACLDTLDDLQNALEQKECTVAKAKVVSRLHLDWKLRLHEIMRRSNSIVISKRRLM